MRERIKQAAKKVHKAAKQIPSPVWGAAPRARKAPGEGAHYSDHIPARGGGGAVAIRKARQGKRSD